MAITSSAHVLAAAWHTYSITYIAAVTSTMLLNAAHLYLQQHYLYSSSNIRNVTQCSSSYTYSSITYIYSVTYTYSITYLAAGTSAMLVNAAAALLTAALLILPALFILTALLI